MAAPEKGQPNLKDKYHEKFNFYCNSNIILRLIMTKKHLWKLLLIS